MKTKKKEIIKVKKRDSQSYNSVANAYSQEDTDLIMSTLAGAVNKLTAAKVISTQINRTPRAILARYNYVFNKWKKENESRPKLDLSFIGSRQPLFIPKEIADNLFMEEVNVLMFKAMDGSLHEKASEAVKANIRTILDSYDEVRDSKNVDDKDLHQWFLDNKNKVEYMLNINSEELW